MSGGCSREVFVCASRSHNQTHTQQAWSIILTTKRSSRWTPCELGRWRQVATGDPPHVPTHSPAYYNRALASEANSTWDFEYYRVDAVVINLGTNDFQVSRFAGGDHGWLQSPCACVQQFGWTAAKKRLPSLTLPPPTHRTVQLGRPDDSAPDQRTICHGLPELRSRPSSCSVRHRRSGIPRRRTVGDACGESRKVACRHGTFTDRPPPPPPPHPPDSPGPLLHRGLRNKVS